MWRITHPFGRRERGQGLVEYALIIMFISIALVGTLGFFAEDLDAFYGTISDAFPA
ncbi:MAG TPA: Flp family type IVb pilin [Dehalococcoidia bacterium]|nr:Flp family type IVb pilin [Dehalococcoidia bacterium]